MGDLTDFTLGTKINGQNLSADYQSKVDTSISFANDIYIRKENQFDPIGKVLALFPLVEKGKRKRISSKLNTTILLFKQLK